MSLARLEHSNCEAGYSHDNRIAGAGSLGNLFLGFARPPVVRLRRPEAPAQVADEWAHAILNRGGARGRSSVTRPERDQHKWCG